jgi:hypothetical protein
MSEERETVVAERPPVILRPELEQDLRTMSATPLRQKYAREASSYQNMKSRCNNGKAELDPSWISFRQFLDDMGPKPFETATLDRTDNTLRRYGPGLCRWVDKKAQTDNRSNTRWVEYKGDMMTAADFARLVEKPYKTVISALDRRETPDQIAAGRAAGPRFDKTSWRHPDPSKEQVLLDSFGLWKPKLTPAYKYLGHIDIFHLIVCVCSHLEADRILTRMGLDEVGAEEWPAEEVRFINTPAWQIRQVMPERIDYALACIGERDPALAERLRPRHPTMWSYLERLLDEAVRPVPKAAW